MFVLIDLDPMGAIIVSAPYQSWYLSTYTQIAAGVIIAWGRTVYRQFELLAGKSAPHDFLQLVVYNSVNFSGDIDKIDTVRAYHVRLLFLSEMSTE